MNVTSIAVLDLAIAMAVSFFLLSLLPAAITEVFAMVTRVRSKFLWSFLRQRFGNYFAVPDSIGSFLRMQFDWTQDPRPIHAPTAEPIGLFGKVASGVTGLGIGSSFRTPDRKTSVKHVPVTLLAQTLVELLPDKDSVAASSLGDATKGRLVALMTAGGNDAEKVRLGIERWMDAEMAQLSGLYKRLIRWFVFAAAAVVAILVNVNPFQLGSDLWRDAARRDQFIGVAASLVDQTASTRSAATSKQLAVVNACAKEYDETTKASDPQPAGDLTKEQAAKELTEVRSCVTAVLADAANLNLLETSVLNPAKWKATWSVRTFVPRAFSLLVLTVALGMGAPFWLSVLRRGMGLRSTLQPHKEI